MHRGTRRASVRVGKLGRFPRRDAITAEQFRDARVFGGLTREQAAAVLDVSLRTIGNWETGKARPPYAAFKLLRVLRHGDFVDARWSGYRIIRGKLVTPENRELDPDDLSWLSLLVRRADAFTAVLNRLKEADRLAARRTERERWTPGGGADALDTVGVHAGIAVVQSPISGAMPLKPSSSGVNNNPPHRDGDVYRQTEPGPKPPSPVVNDTPPTGMGTYTHFRGFSVAFPPCSNTGMLLPFDTNTSGGAL